ncbi:MULTISPECIES: serine hydroxymethyltransferase [unclassified Ruegeria]|uniref:serine hydroxymethyltransferase n=1 Tax=unclassified Ruegeria TaxID=2625375 RepID=UPI001491C687|nr:MULTISPECIES: serine hydroxymethyltransferase [unclassified Ruegeria]NOD36523.1 serine hydroxymethyltransferase [Ruegeria sp. HKCCD7296]NOE43762.1 serine hydroxymethyltransferase [Ruegeria sp. HKCCD7319]
MFKTSLKDADPVIAASIDREGVRQAEQIELIASENIVSQAVIEAQGSVLTNKYAEGYSGRRYYGGCEYVDEVESEAIDRLKKLFGCEYANVQPHSGAQANGAVKLALLSPGDTILGMSLDAGGHLTHGAKPAQSGKWFRPIQYGLTEAGLIDYDQVEALAKAEKPQLIIAGASAYSQKIDFARFRSIADEVGAWLLADMAHIAGLVATGLHPSPIGHAHVVTSTTHKTLRGPRGGIILTNDEALAKKINSAVFPGLQGGPLMHVIAGKAVAFGEALKPEFKEYMQRVVDSASTLANVMIARGCDIVSGGTENHLMLVDLRPIGVTGKDAEAALERAGFTCNKNSVPGDPQKPTVTSGIRLGTAAGCSRGFGAEEFKQIGNLIGDVLDALAKSPDGDAAVEQATQAKVRALCASYPIY